MIWRRPIETIVIHGIAVLAAAIFVVPFVWLLFTAFTRGDRPTLDHFRTIIAEPRVFDWLINSLFIACATTVLVVTVSALAAFALSKLEFRGRAPLMVLMLLTLMVPGQVLLPGTYDLVWRIGWIDSFAALLVPGAVNVLGVFLFRQAMLAVPDDLLHAGRIDGCGSLRLWWDILLPSIRPMIGAFTLLSFVGTWNSFLWPQIVLQSDRKFTVPIGLANLISQPGSAGYGPLMAATLLSLIPVMLLFFALQRDFVAGLTSGAIKG